MNLRPFLNALLVSAFSFPAFAMEDPEHQPLAVSQKAEPVELEEGKLTILEAKSAIVSRLYSSRFHKMEPALRTIKKAVGMRFIENKDFDKAVTFLFPAAQAGCAESSYALGEIQEKLGNYLPACRWFEFAFQQHWIETNEHFQPVEEKLKIFSEKKPYMFEKNTSEEDRKAIGFYVRGLFTHFPLYTSRPEKKDRFKNIQSIIKDADKKEWFDDQYISTYLTPNEIYDRACKEKIHERRAYFLRKSGIASAWNDLGALYLLGKVNGKPDATNAAECFKKAGELGFVDAYYNLGKMYFFGEILPSSGQNRYILAKEYLEKRSEFSSSLNLLGSIYKDGLLGEADFEKARQYFEKAIDKYPSDCKDPANNLAQLYEERKISDSNPDEKAAYYYKMSGLPDALFRLAYLYSCKRIKAEKNKSFEESAITYFRKSNTPEAHLYLGDLYYKKEEYKKAAEQFKLSQTPKAHYALAVLYMNKNIPTLEGKKSRQTAQEYLKKSNTTLAKFVLLKMRKEERSKDENFNLDIEISSLREELRTLTDKDEQGMKNLTLGYMAYNFDKDYLKAYLYTREKTTGLAPWM